MIRIAILLASACLLSGCAGLSVNWNLNASYTSEVPLGERKPSP